MIQAVKDVGGLWFQLLAAMYYITMNRFCTTMLARKAGWSNYWLSIISTTKSTVTSVPALKCFCRQNLQQIPAHWRWWLTMAWTVAVLQWSGSSRMSSPDGHLHTASVSLYLRGQKWWMYETGRALHNLWKFAYPSPLSKHFNCSLPHWKRNSLIENPNCTGELQVRKKILTTTKELASKHNSSSTYGGTHFPNFKWSFPVFFSPFCFLQYISRLSGSEVLSKSDIPPKHWMSVSCCHLISTVSSGGLSSSTFSISPWVWGLNHRTSLFNPKRDRSRFVKALTKSRSLSHHLLICTLQISCKHLHLPLFSIAAFR